MNDMRKVQIYKNNKWRDIDFMQLKQGDKFRMFEPDGEPVISPQSGTSEWITTTDIYLNDEGNLTINIGGKN